MDYPNYIAISQYLKNGSLPLDGTEEEFNKFKEKANTYCLINGILFKKKKIEGEEDLEVLHEGNIEEVIQLVHSEGHFGMNNTWYRMKNRFYSPAGLFQKIKEVVQNCQACQFRKKKPHRRTEVSKPILTPSTPFYMIACDAVGPVITSNKGNRNILVVVDYLTRWPIAKAVKRIDEETVCEFLFNEVVQYHGVPNFLLTDRGSSFLSKYTKTFLKELNCRHITTSAFRPQTNGLCERTNQSLVQAIAKITREKEEDNKNWDKNVTTALMALRTMKNESTGCTPSLLLYGKEMRTPSTWLPPREDYVVGEYQDEIDKRVEYLNEKMQEIRRIAKEVSNDKKAKQRERYNLTVHIRKKYEIGEQVLMKDQYPPNKFADRWIGPMTVRKVNQSGTYHLVGPNAKRLDGAVNGDQLIPFYCKNSMVPDVQQKLQEQLFRSWIERRNATADRAIDKF